MGNADTTRLAIDRLVQLTETLIEQGAARDRQLDSVLGLVENLVETGGRVATRVEATDASLADLAQSIEGLMPSVKVALDLAKDLSERVATLERRLGD